MKNRRRIVQALACLPLSTSLMLPYNTQAATPQALPLKQYSGKVVLADFWASWCGPCRLSMPWLNQMHRQYADQGLHVLGINLDEDATDAARFLQAFPAGFEVLYDPKGQFASYYALITMPTSILFSRDGNQISQHNGFLSEQTEQYEAGIVAALTT